MRAVTPYEALCHRLGARAFLRFEQCGISSVEQDTVKGRNFTWGASNVAAIAAPGGLRAGRHTATSGTGGSSALLDLGGISSYTLAAWVFRNAAWSDGYCGLGYDTFGSGRSWFGMDARTNTTNGYELVHGTGAGFRVRYLGLPPLNRWSLIGMSGTIGTGFPDGYMNGVLSNGSTVNGGGTPSGSTTAGQTFSYTNGAGHPVLGVVAFDRILTAGEWARLYAAGRASGLVIP